MIATGPLPHAGHLGPHRAPSSSRRRSRRCWRWWRCCSASSPCCVTPREEEPQINVTMANVLIPFPGAAVRDVEQMVAGPAEQVLSQIAGVEHVMSVSRPGLAVITVQFKVGVPRIEALVRLYDTVNSNADWLPRGLGVLEPIIKPKGIDDVPIVTLTLFSTNAAHRRLRPRARGAQHRGRPEARARHARGDDHRRPGRAVDGRDRSGAHGRRRRHRDRPAQRAAVGQPGPAGRRTDRRATARWRSSPAPSCARPREVGELVVGVRDGKPVFLRDVAAVRDGPPAGRALCLARRRRQGRRGATSTRR